MAFVVFGPQGLRARRLVFVAPGSGQGVLTLRGGKDHGASGLQRFRWPGAGPISDHAGEENHGKTMGKPWANRG